MEQWGPGKVADRRHNQNPTESQPVGIKRTNEQKTYTNRLLLLLLLGHFSCVQLCATP